MSNAVYVMGGLMGVHPNWATITPPAGALSPANGYTQITYDNVSTSSAEAALDAVMATNPRGYTIYTYSESTDAALNYLQAQGPNDPNVTGNIWILLGAPETPLGGHYTGKYPLTLPGYSTVTFGVKQYDTVADYPTQANSAAQSNASLGVHTSGYNNLNMTEPSAAYTDPVSGATILYFVTEPLPSINKWQTQAQITAEDKTNRPPIELAYNRVPIPVNYPDGTSLTPPTSYAAA